MTMARAPSGIYGADALASIRAEAEKGRTGTGGKEKGPTIAKAPTPVKVPARGGAAAPKGGSDGDEEEEEAPLPSRNSRLSAAGGRKASMTMARAPSGIYGADALASIRAEAEKGRTAAPKKQESNQAPQSGSASPGTTPNLSSLERAPSGEEARTEPATDPAANPAAKTSQRSSFSIRGSFRSLSGQGSMSSVGSEDGAKKPGMWSTVKSWFASGSPPIADVGQPPGSGSTARRKSDSGKRRTSDGGVKRDMSKLRRDSKVGALPRMP